MERVLYLDTNHISRLARDAEHASSKAVLRALRERGFTLALSFLHLIELSAPTFLDRPAVGRLLDALELAWAVHMDDLFDQEIDAAVARLVGQPARGPVVFYSTPIDAWGMPPAAFVLPSAMLEEHAERPSLSDQIHAGTRRAAAMDAIFKRRAAAVSRPSEPLAAAVVARLGPHLPAVLRATGCRSPEQLVERAGGLTAFPAYEVFQRMGTTRYNDEEYKSTANDVVDDLHAIYCPYTFICALDRTTLGRLRSAKLSGYRVFRKLEDVASALDAA